MKKIYIHIIAIAVFVAASVPAHAASMLTVPYDSSTMYYRWLDTEHYDVSSVGLKSTFTFEPHQIYYDFEHIFGTGNNLTQIGGGYAYKGDIIWAGGGISSASNSPFTRLNVVDFNLFAAFKVLNRVSKYAEAPDGSMRPYYMNLYIGIDYSTERILLDGYPLPVIRFEYNIPRYYMVIGFPLTYIKVDTTPGSYFELLYEPVLNGHVAYNMAFNKYNAVEISFRMENKKYRLTDTASDVYYFNQVKYYTQFMYLQASYKLTIENILTIKPYVAFVIDGSTYYGKKFGDFNGRNKTGLGYMVGISFDIKIF